MKKQKSWRPSFGGLQGMLPEMVRPKQQMKINSFNVEIIIRNMQKYFLKFFFESFQGPRLYYI